MKTKSDIYYKAFVDKDSRFDGRIFIAVKTTGIYCRPICPAKPLRKNIEFFATAKGAEKAGYRPCLRCRPEAAPFSPAWMGKASTVRRALKLISKNSLYEKSENDFADQLGISARHLRRLFKENLGLTPKQVHDNNRLNLAQKLVTETKTPITEVAFTCGFSSIRRFNDAFKERFNKSPTKKRRNL